MAEVVCMCIWRLCVYVYMEVVCVCVYGGCVCMCMRRLSDKIFPAD